MKRANLALNRGHKTGALRIHKKIQAYHSNIAGDAHHRYRSWEHCYGFFRRVSPAGLAAQRDNAALQLGFYLASWGMYRGSSFLLQHAYTVHLEVVDCLCAPSFVPLWAQEFGSGDEDAKLVPIILAAVEAVREAYRPFGAPTDTLVTKVILGTFGCLPACDRYFIDGFKSAELKYSYLNAQFVDRVLRFCRDNLEDLRNEQTRIKDSSGIYYPLMKLVDMHFWQTGYELDMENAGATVRIA